jgi:hypothetical protein
MLDAAAAFQLLRRVLGFDPDGVRIEAVRYKPGRRLVVQYEVAAGARIVTAVALADSKLDLRRLARAPGVTWDPVLDCLVQRWPHDAALPTLALPRDELAGRLGVDRGVHRPELLGYKPFARATLRFGRHVAKLYASNEKWRGAADALDRVTHEGLTAASLEGAAADLRATVQHFVEGSVPDGSEVAGPAATLLRRLHALETRGLLRRQAADRLDEAARAATLVGTLVPALEPRLEALLRTLARRMPPDSRYLTTHGDFEPGQLIAGTAGLTLVDVDDLCAASPADDLGRYAAHSVRGEEGDLEALREVVASLVAGYGARPEGLDWYVAVSILARAASPFRRQDPEWPERVEAFVSVAQHAAEAA